MRSERLCLVTVFSLLAMIPSMGHGATYTVINTNDSGSGSLRQAITDANGNAGDDTIVFSGFSGSNTITLGSQLPNISDNVTINGPGAGIIAVDGATSYRCFDVDTGATGKNV